MDIQQVIKASKGLGEWAHIATVSNSGIPYVTPVHPCWEGQMLWIMVGVNSVKSKNVKLIHIIKFFQKFVRYKFP